MNISIHQLSKDTEKEWDLYLDSNKGNLYHKPQWRHLIKEVFGHESFYLFARDESKMIVGILPMVRLKSVLFGNYMISMPYFNYGGCIAENEVIAGKLLVEANVIREKLGCTHTEYRFSEAKNFELPCRQDKVTMILELPEDSDILWKNIGTKRRAQVKRPIREGVEFVLGGAELIDEFYYVFCRNMRDLGTPVYSKKFFAAILSQFPDIAKIAVVRLNGEAVSTGFLLGNDETMEIPWASTLRKVNKIGVNMFLYWNILHSSIELGYKKFDFGRSSKDAGTLRFKKQWGAVEKQLYWYYQLDSNSDIPQINHSNKKYQLMINTWKKMPLSFCNLLGPLIVKNLP